MRSTGPNRLFFLVLILILSTALSGCALIEDIFGGFARLCEQNPLRVTKTEDTDDGLCTGEDCSLREAVITANACEGRQRIEIPPGTYPLTLTGPDEDSARTGDLDITDTVAIFGIAGEVIIDARGNDRVFHIMDSTAEPDVNTIADLTITGGRADFTGGGILHDLGWLNLQDVEISGNEAGASGTVGGAGGGIYARDHLTVTNLTLAENTAHGSGGGAYLEDAYLLVNEGLLVRDNQSLGGEGGGGLFLFGETSADIFDSRFLANETAANGGAIWSQGDLQMERTRFEENIAAFRGGGLFHKGDEIAVLTETWFTNNNAEEGGGIYNEGLVHLSQSGVNNNSGLGGLGAGIYNNGGAALLLIRNSTISANMNVPADEGGGSGILNNGGEVRVEFSTLAYNNTNGIFNRSGLVRLESSVLGHHSGGNCAGEPIDSGGHNLEDGISCSFTESSDLEDLAVGIDRLASNGGFSLSHALLPDSPALDSGDRDTCLPVDQRGVSRPQGPRCDRGAFESEELAGSGSDTLPATDSPTATPTPEETPTATIPATSAITITPTPGETTGTLDRNGFCRTGPGTVYPPATAYEAGTELVIEGQNSFQPKWWVVLVPSTGGNCWISDAVLTVNGPTAQLPEIQAPPTPTPTVPTETPPPLTITPTFQQ